MIGGGAGTTAVLVDGAGALSRAEVDRQLRAVEARLLELAAEPGERVAVIGENAGPTLLTHAAGVRVGVGTVATSRQLRAAEMADQFTDAGVVAAVTGPAGLDAAVEAARLAGLRVVVVHGAEPPARAVVRCIRWTDWAGTDSGAPTSGDRPAVAPLIYTSGTTGRARGTEVRWVSPLPASAARYAAALAAGNSFPEGPHLVCGPLQHNGPLTAVRHLLAGQPVVILPGFDAHGCLHAITEHRVTSAMMVPTHFQRLLALPIEDRERFDVSSLRLVVHTGSACPADVKQDMIEWFGPVLVESYGASEIGTVARIDSHEWLTHRGSVGRARPPFELVILDDDGCPVPAGISGRIAVRAPEDRGIRYHADPEKTASASIAPGLYTLGDLGRLDDDGYLYITGREADMVISGGVNLYPAESEHVLAAHPAVADVAVIGVPHPDLGEALRALVVPASGEPPDPADLDAACRSALAGYKCPKSYELVDELPRNAMGKVDKRSLRTRYWANERTIAG